jgi:hypothetical protein
MNLKLIFFLADISAMILGVFATGSARCTNIHSCFSLPN